MYQLDGLIEINLPAEPCNVNIDDIIQWCPPCRLLPNFPHQCIAQDHLPFMPHQIFQELKFPSCEFHDLATPRDLSRHKVDVEITGTEAKRISRTPATQHCSNSRQQFGKCEGLGKVIVGA